MTSASCDIFDGQDAYAIAGLTANCGRVCSLLSEMAASTGEENSTAAKFTETIRGTAIAAGELLKKEVG